MKVRFISDVHITDASDPFYQRLLAWIRLGEFGDTLIFGGDIFDLMVGFRPGFIERYGDFFSEVGAALERGVEVYYIEGNHDFDLQGIFSRYPQFKRIERGFFIAHSENVRTWFEHGDLADPSDWSYQLWRAGVRSPPLRWVRQKVSDPLLWQIGSKLSQVSHYSNREMSDTNRQKYFHHALEKFHLGYQFVVMGHCHDPHEYSVRIGDLNHGYWNLGYPKRDLTYLQFDSSKQTWVRQPL